MDGSFLFDRTTRAGPTGPEIIADNFAGGGGASHGIEIALGRSPDVAINHDPEALAMHGANHPDSAHLCQSVFRADPRDVAGGRPVGLAWFSPDCRHHSKAKGGQPAKRSVRDLAWVVVHWAQLVRPRVIILENVEEFEQWGPLDADCRPIKAKAGETFKRWVAQLRRCGYRVEWRQLRASDYGAPTIRKRLFLVARCDGRPIVWPEPTHGSGLAPVRTAAEIIDWSIPCPSIFLTREQGRALRVKRPLADATMRRIARGVMRYVVDTADPFIVGVGGRAGQSLETGPEDPVGTITAKNDRALVVPYVAPITHHGSDRIHPIDEPLRTVTTAHRGEFALAAAHLTKFRKGHSGRGLDEPAPTVTANSYIKRPGGAPPIGVVAAFLAQHNTGVVGHDAREPVSTVTVTGSHQGLVASNLVKLRRNCFGQDVRTPVDTISAGGEHFGEIRSFLTKYYGTDQAPELTEPIHTATTRDRFGLVTVEIAGESYVIADIGMRMLTPRELFRAQGFPDSYIIDPELNGKPLTRTSQIRMCGNSVCPPVAGALVAANVPEMAATYAGVAA